MPNEQIQQSDNILICFIGCMNFICKCIFVLNQKYRSTTPTQILAESCFYNSELFMLMQAILKWFVKRIIYF